MWRKATWWVLQRSSAPPKPTLRKKTKDKNGKETETAPADLTNKEYYCADKHEVTMFMWKERGKTQIQGSKLVSDGNMRLLSFLLEQCSPEMRTRLKGKKGYRANNNTQNSIVLLSFIRGIMCDQEEYPQHTYDMVAAKKVFLSVPLGKWGTKSTPRHSMRTSLLVGGSRVLSQFVSDPTHIRWTLISSKNIVSQLLVHLDKPVNTPMVAMIPLFTIVIGRKGFGSLACRSLIGVVWRPLIVTIFAPTAR